MSYISVAQEALIKAAALLTANGDVTQRNVAVSDALLKAADELHNLRSDLNARDNKYYGLARRVELLETIKK